MSLNLLNGNVEALELLDWSQLLSHITTLSHFEPTKEKLLQPLTFRSYEEIEENLNQLDTYLTHFDDLNLIFNTKIRQIPDSLIKFKLVEDAFKERFFEAGDLHFFALLAEVFLDTSSTFTSLFPQDKYLIENDFKQKIRNSFVSPLREFVDHNGNVSYERHPMLKKLNAEILILESELRINIQKIAKRDDYSSKLQLDTYDIINDRYVLAIKSDSYNSILGPIVARSQSGMTLFVEPYEIREKANQRIRLIAEIESLILKLTIELSKIIHRYSGHFKLIANWSLEIDWVNTKATYCLKNYLNKPILNNNFYFNFNGLFHPLIESPIKNDFILTTNHKGMIISGPNTGGKTVALKSFAISLLFTHLGLYVPASHAEIDPISELYYFSHDHQSLSQGLSSFASEAKYYLQLLNTIDVKNIIVIDEIFNSTSSEEASALAISFLDEIHNKSHSKIVLSTHHQVLKTYMHSKSDYASAHVGYDFELNKPTYKLILGEPGSSLAFTIFENLSLKFNIPNSIGTNAKKLLDQKQVTYESLLQELSSKKIELDKLLLANKNLNIDLKNQKSSMEGTLFLERERILADYGKKIKHVFNQAENILNQVKDGSIHSKKNFEKEKFTINKEINSHLEKPAKSYPHEDIYAHLATLSYEDIEVNSVYFSMDFRKNVKIISLNPRKKEAQIKHGVVSLWVTANSLRFSSGPKIQVPNIKINIDKTVKGDIEIDCRGMRLEEFQKASMTAIDEVLAGDIPFVTIIHGHGDGILKGWLRSYLKKEHRDLFWENIEGNDGCTKIYFKV